MANDRRRAKQGGAFPGLSPEEIHDFGLDEDPLASIGSDEADLTE